MMRILFICLICIADVFVLNAQHINGFPLLDMKPPGKEPVIFAPGIVSDELINRDIAISPDGNEIFYSASTPGFNYSAIIQVKKENGIWGKPEVASFSRDPRYRYLEPAFSRDGNILFFSSNMPRNPEGEISDNDIWAVKKNGDSWGIPYNLGPPVNSDGGEYFPSLTADGTIFFTRNRKDESTSYIYKSTFDKSSGLFSDPIKLPAEINCGTDRYNAFVAPDESFVVIPAEGVEDYVYGSNYYITYRLEDGKWTKPVNMGPVINSKRENGWSFSMSPDGKYIFFMAVRIPVKDDKQQNLSLEFMRNQIGLPENGNADIYWMDAGIVKELFSKTNIRRDTFYVKTPGITIHSVLSRPVNTNNNVLAIIIPGSGPTDLNGNQPKMKNNSLLFLSDALVRNNIATVRYDKRGVAESSSKDMDESKMNIESGSEDLIGLIDFYRKMGFEKIYLIGHSEGSLLGLIAAQQRNVAGLVSVCGAGNSADKLLKKQLQPKLPQPLFKEAEVIIDSLKEEKLVKNISEHLKLLFRPSVQPYLISWFKYDPSNLAANLKAPLLIIHGEKDIQIDVAESSILHNASPDSKYVIIKNMNHIFKTINGDLSENVSSYTNPDLQINEEFFRTVVNFINKNGY
ncbi:MAG: alpha/beta hydrolase [Rikenellaceae bacterium]|nr:alpha/beta hydrolase [Rikenellaceae bacterium]